MSIGTQTYKYDMENMTQTNTHTLNVRRIRYTEKVLCNFPGTSRGVPDYWPKEESEVVRLDKNSNLYKEVVGMVQPGVPEGKEVISIDHVRKTALFHAFRFVMYHMTHKKPSDVDGSINNSDTEELVSQQRWLYHGTTEENVERIVETGFAREFNTIHQYGKGTYFAVNPGYSLNERYAACNACGEQFLLLSRVFVGKWCQGDSTMTKLPTVPKGELPYNSMVNNTTAPTIFVLSTHSDNQAYTEFVIRVGKKSTSSSATV